MNERVEDQYRHSEATVRASFGKDQEAALKFYAPLVEFVQGIQHDRNARLLDVGCGVGWSTYAFALEGYRATGIDLNPLTFEPPPHDSYLLREGSATEIPEAADSFEIVVCYQCLEHIPDPGRALDEMARVCCPGGFVVIVGPNLVSPFPKLAELARFSHWGEIPSRRKAGMARHPYGNTWPEILGFAGLRGWQLATKLSRREPGFTLREPDQIPPFHADNDACYLCNPTDLIKDFRGRGFEIIRRGKPGRPPLAYLFAGGTWVAARKPKNEGIETPSSKS